MTGGELAFGDERSYFGRKGEQPECICDRGAGFTYALRKFILRQLVIDHELLHCRCRFDGIEVFALQIFDERDLFYLALVVIADDDGYFIQPRQFSRAEAPFARDNHALAAAVVVDDDGHYDAVLFD